MGLISRVSSRTYRRNLDHSNVSIWGSAAASALVSTCSVQPLDVVKTTLQKSRYLKPSTSSYLQVTKQVYHESSGFRGFYRGLGVALLRSGPGVTFYLSGLEYLRPKFAEILDNENV